MEDINVVVEVGNLVRDAVLEHTTSGFPIMTFTIAVNTRRKSNEEWIEEANFFDCKSFGTRAEGVSKYLKTGKRVAVHGKLRQERWETAEGKRSRIWIYTDNIQLLGDRKPVDGNRRVDDDGIPF